MVNQEVNTETTVARTTAVIRPNTGNYQTVKSAGGSSTKICGDEVSLALVGATLDETYVFVSKVVGTPEDQLRDKYSMRNVGQQRMFLGNLIRGAFAGKDQERAAKIRAALEAEAPKLRAVVDKRMAAEEEARNKAKAEAKAKREAEAAAKKEAAKE